MNRISAHSRLWAALLALAGISQALPTRSTGDIEFWVDGAAFASRGGKTWQELYWTFSPLQLQARDSLGQRTALFRTAIRLSDSTGRHLLNEDWRTTAPMPDSALAVQRAMLQLDQMSVPDLEPGKHNLSFILTDLVSGRKGVLETDIEVPRFTPGSADISQIELSSDIAADSTPSRFRKGGLTVRPHPSRSFGDQSNNKLFYYAEVYNQAGSVAVVNAAYCAAKDPVPRVIRSDTISNGDATAVIYGGMTVDDLENGYYRFWIQAVDRGGRLLAASQANFKVERNPLEVMPQHRKILEEQAALEKEGGEYYSRIELIASQSELAELEKQKPAARREYLRQFWKRRDPEPNTPENEALREHVRRYQQADAQYREQQVPGSETDRGKMYIKYGPPSEIEKRPMEETTNDMLIWRYQGGQVLIFFDRLGVGRFELMYDKQNPGRSDPRYLRQLQEMGI